MNETKRKKTPSRKVLERQDQVLALFIHKVPIQKIAEKLEVSISTTKRDLEAVRANLAERLTLESQAHNMLLSMEEAESRAWTLYDANNDKPGLRIGALRLVKELIVERKNLLQDIGVIASKPATQINQQFNIQQNTVSHEILGTSAMARQFMEEMRDTANRGTA